MMPSVLTGSVEMNESLLTGESDPIIKREEDLLYSGSSVISGKCYAKVIHVGNGKLCDKACHGCEEREKKIESELLGSMKKVTRFTSFLIVPLGILLFLEAVMLRQTQFDQAITSSSAALLGMLPKGLVFINFSFTCNWSNTVI